MIITQDKDKNILIGELKVRDYEGLKDIRDGLMQYNKELSNYQIKTEYLYGAKDTLQTGYSKEGNKLIHRNIVSIRFGNGCRYMQEKINNTYLNSILIFTSLLNELNPSEYDEITKQFINQGIINVSPIDKIWNTCIKDMTTYNNSEEIKNKKKDFLALCAAFKLGIIAYEVVYKIPKSEQNEHFAFQGITIDELHEIAANTSIILEYDRHFKPKEKQNQNIIKVEKSKKLIRR